MDIRASGKWTNPWVKQRDQISNQLEIAATDIVLFSLSLFFFAMPFLLQVCL